MHHRYTVFKRLQFELIIQDLGRRYFLSCGKEKGVVWGSTAGDRNSVGLFYYVRLCLCICEVRLPVHQLYVHSLGYVRVYEDGVVVSVLSV